jgi:hypothetical protein
MTCCLLSVSLPKGSPAAHLQYSAGVTNKEDLSCIPNKPFINRIGCPLALSICSDYQDYAHLQHSRAPVDLNDGLDIIENKIRIFLVRFAFTFDNNTPCLCPHCLLRVRPSNACHSVIVF